ncbi:transposition helper protein [Pseudomonas taiwanensis]|uniref:TniB family NTP-binding protein n=1 Tax=Pseudomonas taiwanensis TaxID=470150 RepID=UPI0015BA2F09|nr:TniB family NTP-binding protein [Pseudomonas taiwanensis]NWL79570.1 transposition helper protein [Pseudomonas taiwanensis]
MTRISEQLVCHDRFNYVKAEIEAVLARARDGDPQLLAVIGPPRGGKTKVVETFLNEHQVSASGRTREILGIVSPKHLTGRALPDACLASLGMATEMFKNQTTATDAFIKVVKRSGTKLIIFDETQHMLERGSSTTVRAAADYLKALFDQTGASIVLVGLPALIGLFQANEQLADRARRPIEYFPYRWEGSDYKSFRSALAGALEYLLENSWETFDCKDSEFARRMYVASAGRYGIINKLFMEVQSMVRSTSNKVASYREFSQAYEKTIIGRFIDFNPFDLTVEIKPEHMALVYMKVMQEVGVEV